MARHDGSARARPFNYGNGVVEIEEPEGESVSPEQLTAQLRATLSTPGRKLPMLPTVALEVMQLSTRPNAKIEELARLIERDMQLAAQVLRVARSPLHAGAMPVVSLSAAIVRLGLAPMRDVVIEAAMNMRVFKAAAYSETMERVRNHSVAVAHLARIVARFTSMDAEYAFICGLVHDAGYAGALIALGDVPRPELRPALTPQIWRCFEELHEELGGTLINHWKMTPEVEAVVRGHHGLRISGHAHPMLAVLGIAEGIACREGFTLEPVLGDGEVLLASRELEDRERTAQAIEVLRLNAPMMKALNAEVAKVVPSLAGAKPAPKR